MYFHASQTKNIKVLEPRVSNHNKPLIYFSDKRENVLVYLSNAIEKYCKETCFDYKGNFQKWGPYSFNNDGIIQIEEYYPNAIYETYKGVEGYIYSTNYVPNLKPLKDINHAYVTEEKTEVFHVEYIKDAYDEIMKEVEKGNLVLLKYEELIKVKKDWLKSTIIKEYQKSENHPEYRHFLKAKFPFLKENNNL